MRKRRDQATPKSTHCSTGKAAPEALWDSRAHTLDNSTQKEKKDTFKEESKKEKSGNTNVTP